MPQGDKSAYIDKQKRQAHHIKENYEQRGVPDEEAQRHPWRRKTRYPEAEVKQAPQSPSTQSRKGATTLLHGITSPQYST